MPATSPALTLESSRAHLSASVYLIILLVATMISCFGASGSAAEASPTTAEQAEELIKSSKLAMKTAEQRLASRKDDPCYPTLLEKEYARLSFGSDLPWITCTEVGFELIWALRDTWDRHGDWPSDVAHYRLRETYPGYLMLAYDQDNRSLLRQMRLQGPSGAPVKAELESMQASFMVESPRGKPRVPDISGVTSPDPNRVTRSVIELVMTILSDEGGRFATVQTNRVDLFAIDTYNSRFNFKMSTDYSPENKVIWQSFEVNPAPITVIEERLVAPPARLHKRSVPHQPSINMINELEGKQLTSAEIMQSLKRGLLEKTYPLNYQMQPMPDWGLDQRGTLTLRITYGPPPEMIVIPDSGLHATGPTVEGKFEPPHKDFILRNPGKIPLSYEVKPDKTWLKTSPASGDIAAGGETRVRLAVKPEVASKLRNGTHKAKIAFTNTSSGKGDTTRPGILEIGPEQLWRVVLKGHRFAKHREVVGILDPGASKGRYINYFHGMKFTYDMTAEIVIRQKDGHWVYKSGRITAARVKVAYHQQPELYTVDKQTCSTCPTVTRLKNKSIRGSVQDDKAIILYWPQKTPTAEIEARLKLKCLPGPTYQTCLGQKKQGTTYSMQDDDFLQRANGHVLPLRDGSYRPKYKANRTGTGELLIDHRYQIKRLK